MNRPIRILVQSVSVFAILCGLGGGGSRHGTNPSALFAQRGNSWTSTSAMFAAPPQTAAPEYDSFPKQMRIVGSDATFKFLHREHAKTKVRIMECKDCHTMDAEGVIESIPQHPRCVECHLQRTDVKPPMLQCAGCHVGYEFDDARRTVSYAFTHKSHLIDKKTGRAIKCEECHQVIPTRLERFDMTLPAVHECMQCHNGRDSFIVYDCARCHNPITAPDSHRLETMPHPSRASAAH